MFKSKTREKIEILNVLKSDNEDFIGIICGKFLMNNDIEATQLFLLQREKLFNSDKIDKFTPHKRIDLTAIEGLKNFSD